MEPKIQTFLRHKLQILLIDSLQERYSHKSLTDTERVYSSVHLTNAFFESVRCGFPRGKKKVNKWLSNFLNENVSVTVSPDRSRLWSSLLAGLGFKKTKGEQSQKSTLKTKNKKKPTW